MQPYKTLQSKRQVIRKISDRGVAIFYTLAIYFTLPVAPRWWEIFSQKVGNFADYFAAMILLIFGFFIIFYLIAKQSGIQNFIWLIILAFFYTFGLSRLPLSIEKIHFVEYGLLSFFVFRALRHNLKDASLYFWSAIVVFCLGFLDEGIQWMLPNRVYDIKDVVVNGASGVLALLLIGLCFQPRLEILDEKNR